MLHLLNNIELMQKDSETIAASVAAERYTQALNILSYSSDAIELEIYS